MLGREDLTGLCKTWHWSLACELGQAVQGVGGGQQTWGGGLGGIPVGLELRPKPKWEFSRPGRARGYRPEAGTKTDCSAEVY